MPSYKTARGAEEIKRELAEVFRRLKDPRITGLLSVSRVELSNDLSWCKVYVSSLEGLDACKSAVKGLESAAGFIRREVGSKVKMRHVPAFLFFPDAGMEHSFEIDNILKKL